MTFHEFSFPIMTRRYNIASDIVVLWLLKCFSLPSVMFLEPLEYRLGYRYTSMFWVSCGHWLFSFWSVMDLCNIILSPRVRELLCKMSELVMGHLPLNCCHGCLNSLWSKGFKSIDCCHCPKNLKVWSYWWSSHIHQTQCLGESYWNYLSYQKELHKLEKGLAIKS